MGPTWATLIQVFCPVLVLKEMVVKMFQQPPQGSELVKGDGVDDAPDGALDCCMRESSQMVEGNGVDDDPVADLDCGMRESSQMVEGNGVDDDPVAALDCGMRESSQMVEGNGVDDAPVADLDCGMRESSQMVEGNGVDDAPDGALDCCMRESSQMVEGNGVDDDLVAALDCGMRESLQMVEGNGVDDAPDGAFDCGLRESSQMVEGKGVDDDPVAALGRSLCESSKTGEIETVHRGLTHSVDIEDINKPHPDAEYEPCESGHDTLKPIKERQVIDQHPAESLDRLSYEVSKRGKKRATTAENSQGKKRKRGRNWTDHGETENLIHLRLQSLRNKGNVSRLDMNESNERVWEAISKHLPERTAEECQNRWDTVVRSYKTIKSYLHSHDKEFSQVSVEDLQKMQVAPYFRSAEWYKMFGKQREVWDRSRGGKGRRVANMNIGASTTTGMPALPSAEPIKSDAFRPEVVEIDSPFGLSEARVAACELPVVLFTMKELEIAQDDDDDLPSLLDYFSSDSLTGTAFTDPV